jgi:hypothetical protein
MMTSQPRVHSAKAFSCDEVVATTVHPACFASWTANDPAAPAPAVTRTTLPLVASPEENTAPHDVVAEMRSPTVFLVGSLTWEEK